MRLLWSLCLLVGTAMCGPLGKVSWPTTGTGSAGQPLYFGPYTGGAQSSVSSPNVGPQSGGSPPVVLNGNAASFYGSSGGNAAPNPSGQQSGGSPPVVLNGNAASWYGSSGGNAAPNPSGQQSGGSPPVVLNGNAASWYGQSETSVDQSAPEDAAEEEAPEEEEPVFSDVSDLEPLYTMKSRSSYQRGRAVFSQTRYIPGAPAPPPLAAAAPPKPVAKQPQGKGV